MQKLLSFKLTKIDTYVSLMSFGESFLNKIN